MSHWRNGAQVIVCRVSPNGKITLPASAREAEDGTRCHSFDSFKARSVAWATGMPPMTSSELMLNSVFLIAILSTKAAGYGFKLNKPSTTRRWGNRSGMD